ncbi:MAG TPA: ferritin-like domain-containing protein [Solirubrobacteraceae bacterium]|nr:ferritin-like domain-containing protein [Solirubrobacteraceae bacterium]
MEDASVSRGQFLRNAAKGGIVLATSGGVLAAAEGAAFASTAKGDIAILQAAYTAESLAVFLYSAIVENFDSFRHPRLKNRDYFVAALRNERDHRAFLAEALGHRKPTGLRFKIPPAVTRTGQSLLNTGVALETAFVEAYLGAVEEFRSKELKLVAAKVAANEATHFSFFDAAAGPGPKANLGGHGVLPSLPSTATIPATVRKLKPFLG